MLKRTLRCLCRCRFDIEKGVRFVHRLFEIRWEMCGWKFLISLSSDDLWKKNKTDKTRKSAAIHSSNESNMFRICFVWTTDDIIICPPLDLMMSLFWRFFVWIYELKKKNSTWWKEEDKSELLYYSNDISMLWKWTLIIMTFD